jgi:hypothetical protein
VFSILTDPTLRYRPAAQSWLALEVNKCKARDAPAWQKTWVLAIWITLACGSNEIFVLGSGNRGNEFAIYRLLAWTGANLVRIITIMIIMMMFIMLV